MKRLSIVVVEDNRGDLLLVREALNHHGLDYDLSIATDGEEGIRMAQRMGADHSCPDLLLLDLNLPKADGYQVLKAFRDQRSCDALPVIIVTSSDSPQDRARAAAMGANHYFCKPSDYEAFLKLGEIARSLVDGNGARVT